jgi:hypothetical protein
MLISVPPHLLTLFMSQFLRGRSYYNIFLVWSTVSNSWLSGMQASRILLQLVDIRRKFAICIKLFQNKVVMHISSCSCLAVGLPAATSTAVNDSLPLGCHYSKGQLNCDCKTIYLKLFIHQSVVLPRNSPMEETK